MQNHIRKSIFGEPVAAVVNLQKAVRLPPRVEQAATLARQTRLYVILGDIFNPPQRAVDLFSSDYLHSPTRNE